MEALFYLTFLDFPNSIVFGSFARFHVVSFWEMQFVGEGKNGT
jgi:hypothetical protein